MRLGCMLAAVARRLPVRGRARLAHRLFLRSRSADEWWQVRLGGRLEVRLPASSRQSWITAFTGAYDRSQVDLLASYLRPGSVALDVGASLGLYTVQLADRARRQGGRVVAVEPVPANAAIIRDNLARNGLTEYASVIEVALGARTGSEPMLVEHGGAGNASMSSGVATQEMERHAAHGGLGFAVHAPVNRLDDLELASPVSVVKMDVEGYELDILSGGDEFVARHRPVIFAEFSEPWMRSRGRSLEEPFEWARNHSYSVFRVHLAPRLILAQPRLHLAEIRSPAERGSSELLLVPR